MQADLDHYRLLRRRAAALEPDDDTARDLLLDDMDLVWRRLTGDERDALSLERLPF